MHNFRLKQSQKYAELADLGAKSGGIWWFFSAREKRGIDQIRTRNLGKKIADFPGAYLYVTHWKQNVNL